MILYDIAEKTKERVKKAKDSSDMEIMKKRAFDIAKSEKNNYDFMQQLKKDEMSFICEIKKASPSKGIIAKDFPYIDIAKEYEKAGADMISVLTEPDFFMGSTKYLEEIHKNVNIPLLRKDFVIDEYMIYEAKIIGASAVLLICSLLDEETLSRWIQLCKSLNMSSLTEAHDESEIGMAVNAGAEIIGVNNRDLKTFDVDVTNCLKLREKVPDDILFIAESGIKTNADIELLKRNGVDGVLIGETLMRSSDKQKKLDELKGKAGTYGVSEL